MTRITISYKKVTLTEISHACKDNEKHIKEENFDLEKHDKEIRNKTIGKFVKILFVNDIIDKSVVRRVVEQMKEQKI